MEEEKPIEFQINSEFGVLETVIVCEPGGEIERLSLTNKDLFLFDDIPSLPEMQEEHRAFVELLKKHTSCEVLDLRKDILSSVLEDPKNRIDLISRIVAEEGTESLRDYLKKLPKIELINTIFLGITIDEWRQYQGMETTGTKDFVFLPIPNAYFMRDPAAVIADGVISSTMKIEIRKRESLIIDFAFERYKRFKKPVKFYKRSECRERILTIEGGDVMVINNEAIAIGSSQRTSIFAIEKLAENIFNTTSSIKRIFVPRIPLARAYMHLDTVITLIGPDTICVYPEVMNEFNVAFRCFPTRLSKKDKVRAYFSEEEVPFLLYLQDEIRPRISGGKIKIVKTGGGDPWAAEREQWADATNTLAIAPNLVITYSRSYRTNEALKNHGVEVISFNGSELVRGRGGPRCMTLPLRRKDE